MSSQFPEEDRNQKPENAPVVLLVPRFTPDSAPLDEEQVPSIRNLPPMLRAVRPLQWTKNLLVFAALVFARETFNLEPLLKSIGAFIAFCAVSSSVYLVNDVRDRVQDRLHPVKRLRPVAAGEMTSGTAMIAAAILAISGLVVGAVVALQLLAVLLLYLVLMIGYNAGLKHVVVLDIILIAVGFVLRAAGGAIAIDVPISPWLYLCTFVVSLLVGFGKRRHELIVLQGDAAGHRQNLETYSVQMLDQSIIISAAATLLSYAIYTVQAPTLPDNHAMVLTIPIVAYAVFRYLYLIYIRRDGGSPEVMLVRDRPLQLAVVSWLIASLTILTLT
ncbi:MAG: decaprenyl-phosphate phosphoribosyltransferase [Thermomicrobiales bacterium]